MISYNVTINGIEVHAHYTEKSVQNIFLPLLCRLSDLQRKKKRRILVMLAAPPGAGKSTLASFLQYLADREPDILPVTVIGMDGFHRYQDDLMAHRIIRDGKEVSLVEIKGAPVTFSLNRLTERIRRVAAGEECGWPEYNRLLHNPIEDKIIVKGDIVLLEGNYLLLDKEGWRDLAGFADYTIRIEAEEEVLKKRLVERKIQSGADRKTALHFVEFSDMANVRECLEHTKKADLTLTMDEEGFYERKTAPPHLTEIHFFKLEIFIPEANFRQLQKALQEADAGHIGSYDSCLSYSRVTGTWRPLTGTNPYIGSENQISEEPEVRVEVTCRAERLEETIQAIKAVHPYEEPVINVIPLYRVGI